MEAARSNVQPVEANFFDLDDILAKSTAVPCTFDKSMPADFFSDILGVNKPKQAEEKDFTIDVPLWLVESVRTQCKVGLPIVFNDAMISVLQADATSVNLSRNEPYFYAVGMEVCRLTRDDDQETAARISKCLVNSLSQRLGGVVAKALHGDQKADKLDCLENTVFQFGRKCKQNIDDWLKCSSNVVSRKRKLNT